MMTCGQISTFKVHNGTPIKCTFVIRIIGILPLTRIGCLPPRTKLNNVCEAIY